VGGAKGTLEGRFAHVAREWARITNAAGPLDDDHFAAIAGEAQGIVDAGRWVSGPEDLLTIIGRQRAELFHSRVLGWLMTPTGKHGMGSAFLLRLVRELWPDEEVGTGGPIVIELEKSRSGVSTVSGETHEARADVVVSLERIVIVVENKLDAGEQPAQCERLYWAWRDSAVDSRWVYLTITGRRPTTAYSDEALSAWRTLSYAQVAVALDAALADTDRGELHPGRAAALQYLTTLQAQAR
jgi:hypothetical protein